MPYSKIIYYFHLISLSMKDNQLHGTRRFGIFERLGRSSMQKLEGTCVSFRETCLYMSR